MRDIVAEPGVDFDGVMTEVCQSAEPWRVRLDHHIVTRGGLEWGDADWRLGKGCILEGTGTIELNPDIPDERLKIQAPIHLVPSARLWAAGLTGEAAWRAVPRGMQVRGLRFVLNHSKIAARAKALGVSLRISAVVLQGHEAVIEHVKALDCGAIGEEAFPFEIAGAKDGLDRNALSTVDQSCEFDTNGVRSRIEGVEIEGYVPSASNAQVSHAMIVGATCNDRIVESPWAEVGNWRQILRRDPLIKNVRGTASGDNLCQLATIYQCRIGEITECFSRGYSSGAYGDYLSSHDLYVHHNDFEAKRPVAFLLSPTAGAVPMNSVYAALAGGFSHDDPKVISNWLRCLPVDEGDHAGVLLLRGPSGGRRHIGNVLVDDNDIVMQGEAGAANYAVRAQGVDMLNVTPSNRIVGFSHPWKIEKDCTGVTLPFDEKKKGCRPF